MSLAALPTWKKEFRLFEYRIYPHKALVSHVSILTRKVAPRPLVLRKTQSYFLKMELLVLPTKYKRMILSS